MAPIGFYLLLVVTVLKTFLEAQNSSAQEDSRYTARSKTIQDCTTTERVGGGFCSLSSFTTTTGDMSGLLSILKGIGAGSSSKTKQSDLLSVINMSNSSSISSKRAAGRPPVLVREQQEQQQEDEQSLTSTIAVLTSIT